MKLNDLLNKLYVKRNGQFFKMRWCTNLDRYICASAKKSGNIVTKEVVSTVRKGVNYANIKRVQEKLIQKGQFQIDPISGEIEVLPDGLKWGQYVNGLEGLIIQHNNNHYVRLYTTPNRSKVKYFLNGYEITKEELQEKQILINSYWTRENIEDVMTLRVDSIQEVY